MFVLIYIPGPAWQTVKTATELPFYREHYQYMKQVFATGQLLMGGPFLDNQGAPGILDVEDEAHVQAIIAHDPFVLARVVELHLHPWQAHSALAVFCGAWANFLCIHRNAACFGADCKKHLNRC